MIVPDADLTVPPPALPCAPAHASMRLPGGTRRLRPTETIARVQPLFDDLDVALERIDENEDLGAPIYWAYQRQKYARGYPQQEWNFGGKGVTEDLARASVMMESIERVYGSRLHHPELVRARFDDIADRAIHPKRLVIGEASFDASRVQEWGFCRSLMTGEPRLVHANFLLTPYRAFVGETLFAADFNGLASGNDLEEAVLHGLYELVERDAWVLFHHRTRRVTPIDPATVEDESCRRILEGLERRGAHVLLVDVSADDAAHTIGVLAFDDGFLDVPVAPLMTGTSDDPSIALCRALTELCQWRANLIFVRARMPAPTSLAKNRARCARFLEERGYVLDAPRPLRSEPSAEASIREQLDRVIGRLARSSVDVFMARIASVPGRIEVVKLVAEGLQPLTSGVDYHDGGDGEARFSRRLGPRLMQARV